VFVSIIFGALSLGRESQFGPDYGKAKVAAARIFALFDKNPGTIDSYSTEGVKPVLKPTGGLFNTNIYYLPQSVRFELTEFINIYKYNRTLDIASHKCKAHFARARAHWIV